MDNIEFIPQNELEVARIAQALERNRIKRNATDLHIPLLDYEREEARRMLASMKLPELELAL